MMKKHIKAFFFLAACAYSLIASANSFDDFFRAVRVDDGGAVRNLLARGFDPNTRDVNGRTGLLIAVQESSSKVTKILIDDSKTDVEARNSKDESPLMLAALKGQQELVARLIERGADINKPGWTPLHYAATGGHVAIIRQLLDQYAFIDAQSPNGTTPLMMAAMYGSEAAVKLLLDEGADPLMKNQLGMSAMDFARKVDRVKAAEMIGAAMRSKIRPSDGKW
jgi:ankyrin repeat protein